MENHFNIIEFQWILWFLEISPVEVLTELKSLDPISSKVAVAIETKIFKLSASELARPLANIFNNLVVLEAIIFHYNGNSPI